MKRLPALHPGRGFFTLPVALAILAVSGGLALLAGPHHRDSTARSGLAPPPVRAADVAAVDPAADAARLARQGDASAGVDALLP